MSTAQSNGAPTTSASTNNNGGSVKANGGASNTQLNANSVSSPDVGVFGSVVAEGYNQTAKAVGAGTFSHNHDRPLAFRVTGELGGVPNTALNTAQNPLSWIHGIHPRQTVRTNQIATAIRNNQWNMGTGKWVVPPTVTNDLWYSVSAAGTVSSISAADTTVDDNPEAPGTLTYVIAGKPTGDSYRPRTTW